MLSYVEFKAKIKEELLNNMSPAIRNCNVVLDSKLVDGEQKDFFYIKDSSERGVLPMAINSLYKELYIKEYKEDFDKTVKCIAREYEKKYRSMTGVQNKADTGEDNDDTFEFDMKKVFYCVINNDNNREMLNNIPHINKGELAIYFRLLVATDDNSLKSMIIDKKLMEQLKENDISLEDLLSVATDNTPKLFPVKVNDLGNGIYLVSNNYMKYGASTLFYPENPVKGLSEITKKNMIILPIQTDYFICIENDESLLDEDMYKQTSLCVKKYVTEFGGSALSASPYMLDADTLSLRMGKDAVINGEVARSQSRSI